MEENKIQIINNSDALETLNRSEIDIQVQTAMRYPKHSTPEQINFALSKAEAFALVDSETAESCFYRLERKDKNGEKSIIEGPSIRLAEIVANSWGNIRIATRIVANDGKFITAQAACHDLESNVIQVIEVKRSITNKQGYTFSNDMQVVTGNAAASIARRNAILAVIPAAIFKPLYAKIQQRVLGEVKNDLENRRANMFKTFAKLGVTPEMLCRYVNVTKPEEITVEQVVQLGMLYNALKDGQTTVEETFKKPLSEAALAKAEEVKAQVEAMKARRKGTELPADAPAAPAEAMPGYDDMPPADAETGEMFNDQQ